MKSMTAKAIIVIAVTIFLFGCDRVEKDWKAAQQSGTVTAYGDYLGKHPQSIHDQEAKKTIDDLDWRDAKTKNTVNSYSEYLKKHSGGQYVNDAARLKEEAGMSSIEGKLMVSMMLGGPTLKTVNFENKVYQVFTNSNTKYINIQTDGNNVLWAIGSIYRIKGTVSEKLPAEFRNAAHDAAAKKFIVAREISIVK